jgi:hypothetical protein
MSRGAAGTTDLTVAGSTLFVRAKADAANDESDPDVLALAVRNGNTIYMWEGTRIEDTQTVQIGSTPPPDGSVTYEKLADSATEFHNRFFRDYVDPNNSGVTNDTVFRNTLLATWSYTKATGVVAYTGLNPGDLDTVKALFDAGVPLQLVRFSVEHNSSTDGHTFEEILAVDDIALTVTISPGFETANAGGGVSLWDGAIVRGNTVLTNDNLVSFTYDRNGSNPGRIMYNTGLDFSQQQVVQGMVFVDNAGNKWPILARDRRGS